MSDTTELQKDLDALNAEWDAVTAKRKAWMDEHMADFAKYPIGTTLYLRDSGQPFGTVSGYYRFHADRDPQYDRSMSIYYRMSNGDNTSRLGGNYCVESREERAVRLKREAERLSGPA
jgi:hypothetical protein